MMTLLGTIAGVALIGIPLGAFLYIDSTSVVPLGTNGDRAEVVVTDSMDIGCGYYDY